MLTISKKLFGTIGKEPVYLFTLSHPAGLRVSVCNYGGIIQSILVPHSDTSLYQEIVLGYDTLDEYLSDQLSFGATIGPIADIIKGASFVLEHNIVCWEKNAGSDCLHSGSKGFQNQLWNYSYSKNSLILSKKFPPYYYDFPSAMDVVISFSLPAPDTLQISYATFSSGITAINLTNHTYFRLDFAEDISNQYLKLNTDCSTPVDFQKFCQLSSIFRSTNSEIRCCDGLDHYFPILGTGLRSMAWLYSPISNLLLTCSSSTPGILLFTGNTLGNIRGKNGELYKKHSAICLETECIPNAINQEKYRNEILYSGGKNYSSVTQYRFRHLNISNLDSL